MCLGSFGLPYGLAIEISAQGFAGGVLPDVPCAEYGH